MREQEIEEQVRRDRHAGNAARVGGGGVKEGRRWEEGRCKGKYVFSKTEMEARSTESGANGNGASLQAAEGRGRAVEWGWEATSKTAATEGQTARKGKKKRVVGLSVDKVKARMHQLVAEAYAPSSVRAVKAAMGAWRDYGEWIGDERPELLMVPRWAGDIQASVHNETSLMMCAAWMEANGLAPSTIGTYISLIKTNLGVAFGWALTCKEMEMRLPRLLKAIRRMNKRIRKKRLGWRARYERLLEAEIGAPRGEEAWTQAALRRVMRQALLRGADCLPEKAGGFKKDRHSVVGDLAHFGGEKGPYWRMLVQPAKKAEQGGKTEFVYFPKGDGVTDAYTAIEKLGEERQRAGTWGENEPLFRHANGESWTVEQVRQLFKMSGQAIGVNPQELGAHSGRIGGATDLFAENADGVMLQIQGRW